MALVHSGQFVFKGGTSLSKAFKIIERFSEDIDILLLAFDNTTEAEREQLMESITALVEHAISATEARQLRQDRGVRRTTRLNYSQRVPKGAAEFTFLRLELGFAGGARPHATVPISSLLVDAFDAADRDTTAYDDLSPCNVPVLHPGRTLIEKLSLLHSRVAEAEQRGSPDSPRLWARHYYDVHCLLNHAPARELCRERDEFLRLVAEAEAISLKEYPDRFMAPRPVQGFGASRAFAPEVPFVEEIGAAYSRIMSEFYWGKAPAPTWEQVRETVRMQAALL